MSDTQVARTYGQPVPDEMSMWQPDMQGMKFSDEEVKYTPVRFEQQSNYSATTVDFQAYTTDRSAFYDLQQAAIEVDFDVTQSDGTPIELSDQTALASNGWSLFDTMQISVNGKVIQDYHQGAPKLVSHMQNLTRRSREWLETVGKNSHHFVDIVSDSGIGITGYAGPHVTGTAAPAATTLPVNSFYHEHESDKEDLGSGAYALTRTAANSKFDKTFKEKVDLAVLHGTRGKSQKIFLPLTEICPLLESLDKVVQGVVLKVDSKKVDTAAKAVFGVSTDCLVKITGFALWVPTVQPTLSALARFQKSISEKPRVELQYRDVALVREQISNPAVAGQKRIRLESAVNNPTRVLVGFRDVRRDSDRRFNPLEFDLCGGANPKTIGISRIHLRANGVSTPSEEYLPKEDSHRILQDLYRIYGKNMDATDSCVVTSKSWQDLHSIFAFSLDGSDAQAQFESSSSVNLELVFESDACNYNYEVVALIESKAKGFLDYSSGETKILTVR